MSEELEQYHQNGGTYVIPIEIMNYWIEEYEKLQSVIDKAIKKIQLLIDIGFDYDGYRQADSLMTLIDELVSYAKESRDILRSKE